MAGICGFLGFEDKKLLRNMSRFISHKGDNEVIITDEKLGLWREFMIS